MIDEVGFHLTVEIPANTSAKIKLPNADLSDVTESRTPLDQVTGIEHSEQDGNVVVIHAGSGRYSFYYPSQVLVNEWSEYHEGTENDEELVFDQNSKIVELLAVKEKRVVLEKHLPQLMNSPWLSQVMNFSIDTAMQALPERYQLSGAELQELKNELFKM